MSYSVHFYNIQLKYPPLISEGEIEIGKSGRDRIKIIKLCCKWHRSNNVYIKYITQRRDKGIRLNFILLTKTQSHEEVNIFFHFGNWFLFWSV